MACSGETNLKGLRSSSNNKAIPNEAEELFTIGWTVVKTEVDKLTNAGWSADRRGDSKKANLFYKGANTYFYLIHLAIIVRNYIDGLGVLDSPCNSVSAEEKYNLKCVESNLSCLGKTYGTNYTLVWNTLLQEFGIDRQTDICADCCPGLSEMTIGSSDDCKSFIVGSCEENEQPNSPYGEFEPFEFKINEFTKTVSE